MKELAKALFASFTVLLAAIGPIGLLWVGVFWRYPVEGYWALCLGAGIASLPLGWFGLFFANMVGGFFVRNWAPPSIRDMKHVGPADGEGK